MSNQRQRQELMVLPILLVAIILIVIAHFFMKPDFYQYEWVEYSLALLPFTLFGLVIFAFYIAQKNSDDE